MYTYTKVHIYTFRKFYKTRLPYPRKTRFRRPIKKFFVVIYPPKNNNIKIYKKMMHTFANL